MEGSASPFRKDYLNYGRLCFIGANINNQSKVLCDMKINLNELNI